MDEIIDACMKSAFISDRFTCRSREYEINFKDGVMRSIECKHYSKSIGRCFCYQAGRNCEHQDIKINISELFHFFNYSIEENEDEITFHANNVNEETPIYWTIYNIIKYPELILKKV